MPYRLVRTADGFRGTFLFLVGMMFVPTGISLIVDGRPLRDRNPALMWMPEAVCVWHLGALLLATALAATTIGLFSARFRRRPRLIGLGYVAAMLPPTVIVILGVLALIYGADAVRVLLVTFPNLVLAAAIFLGSEWPNPTPGPPPLVSSAPDPTGGD